MSKRPLSLRWDSETLYFDGDEYYEALISAIQGAKHLITIEMYMFDDDGVGQKITSSLMAAFHRGVKIKLIVDGVGSYEFCDHFLPRYRDMGIPVKVFHPLPFYHPWFGQLSWIDKIKKLFYRIGKMNKRNHRKIITIDENTMFSGSFNITKSHSSLFSSDAWKDVGMKIQGEIVQYAVLRFLQIWKLGEYFRYRKQFKRKFNYKWKSIPIRLNQNFQMRSFYYKDLLTRLRKSQKRIWLITPYFVPKKRVIKLLAQAAKRGCDVRIMISGKSDVKLFLWLQTFYYPYLLKNGVKIYQFLPSVLHAKNYIIDDWMSIGTSNLNYRSFIHDLEVDVVLQEEQSKKQLSEFFELSCTQAELITEESILNRPFFHRFMTRLYFLLRYWL